MELFGKCVTVQIARARTQLRSELREKPAFREQVDDDGLVRKDAQDRPVTRSAPPLKAEVVG